MAKTRTMRACALVACAAGALALLSGAAAAQSNRTLTQVERDRRAETARAERLRTEAARARTEAAQLDRRLVDSGRRRAEAEAMAAAAEARMAALQLELSAESARNRQARSALESALIAAALAQRAGEPRAVRAGMFARAAAPGFSREERRSLHAVAHARNLEDAIAEERETIALAQTAIEAERTELAALLQTRRTAQAALTRDAAAADRRVRALAQEARTLRDLTARVQQAAVRRSGQGAGTGAVPAAWLAPAAGTIIRAFGARESGGPAAQGALLRTRAGAQVVSPAAGEVSYAGPFRSYGQVLILNLDGGYALVLTGLDTINARVGETVRAGQTIGEMPSSDTPAPELYVEVRQGGQPIDPGRWLSARGLAAERSVRAG